MIVPALRDLMLCRRLECTWGELQDMPEEIVAVWEAVISGEEQAQRQRAASK